MENADAGQEGESVDTTSNEQESPETSIDTPTSPAIQEEVAQTVLPAPTESSGDVKGVRKVKLLNGYVYDETIEDSQIPPHLDPRSSPVPTKALPSSGSTGWTMFLLMFKFLKFIYLMWDTFM